ncbi:unnamed protein product [Blepharisma stoltei]|uniref:Cyclic nucleotide-binding domain-containing protein n=1 Tax=Blepharisma stoltei TaxID=1481888 RepID=A0AAU9K3B6_9CILI|nr:unnamed protein product [Blepharisma stoltei]
MEDKAFEIYSAVDISNPPTKDLYKTSRLLPRVRSSSPRARNNKYYKELQEATKKRLVEEISRPKILIENFHIEKPRPITHFINKARTNFIIKLKQANDQRSESTERSKTRTPNHFKEDRGYDFRYSTPLPRYSSATNINNSSPVKKEIDMKNYIPEWLILRNDFQQTYRKIKEGNDDDIANIVNTPAAQRTEDEKNLLYVWISNIKFFSKTPRIVVKETCDKLYRMDFNPGEYLIQKGDIADCMFIIFSGRVGIYLSHESEKIGIKEKKDVVGEKALDTDMPRSAEVKAEEYTITFVLKKIEYQRVLMNIKKLEKHDTTKFLMNIRYFGRWSFLKVQRLSSFMIVKNYQAGEVLFNRGDTSNTFYVIKQGKVEIQVYIDVERQNKWPTASQQWKIMQINRKYIINLQTLLPGDFFGEADLIDDCPRQTRAICTEPTTCLTINKSEFFEVFSNKDIESIKSMKSVIIPSKEDLQKKLLLEIEERNTSEKAILDALKVDFITVIGRDNDDKRTKKLKDWVNNYKKRKTEALSLFNKRIVKEMKKTVNVAASSTQNLFPDKSNKSILDSFN